eukprot:Nk52_evm25s2133 gene=Nk52_evmTU25s2133
MVANLKAQVASMTTKNNNHLLLSSCQKRLGNLSAEIEILKQEHEDLRVKVSKEKGRRKRLGLLAVEEVKDAQEKGPESTKNKEPLEELNDSETEEEELAIQEEEKDIFIPEKFLKRNEVVTSYDREIELLEKDVAILRDESKKIKESFGNSFILKEDRDAEEAKRGHLSAALEKKYEAHRKILYNNHQYEKAYKKAKKERDCVDKELAKIEKEFQIALQEKLGIEEPERVVLKEIPHANSLDPTFSPKYRNPQGLYRPVSVTDLRDVQCASTEKAHMSRLFTILAASCKEAFDLLIKKKVEALEKSKQMDEEEQNKPKTKLKRRKSIASKSMVSSSKEEGAKPHPLRRGMTSRSLQKSGSMKRTMSFNKGKVHRKSISASPTISKRPSLTKDDSDISAIMSSSCPPFPSFRYSAGTKEYSKNASLRRCSSEMHLSNLIIPQNLGGGQKLLACEEMYL